MKKEIMTIGRIVKGYTFTMSAIEADRKHWNVEMVNPGGEVATIGMIPTKEEARQILSELVASIL